MLKAHIYLTQTLNDPWLSQTYVEFEPMPFLGKDTESPLVGFTSPCIATYEAVWFFSSLSF